MAALPQGQATFTKARGVLADVAHHSDHAIRVAARTVIMFSDDDHEALEARQLWLLVNATRPSSQANNHLPKGGTDVFRK
ncbi:MAG: hypothetical protein L0H12_06840 [Nitrosospira sp.]|nr:hypothetical protein [Nitrosospira sp.]